MHNLICPLDAERAAELKVEALVIAAESRFRSFVPFVAVAVAATATDCGTTQSVPANYSVGADDRRLWKLLILSSGEFTRN